MDSLEATSTVRFAEVMAVVTRMQPGGQTQILDLIRSMTEAVDLGHLDRAGVIYTTTADMLVGAAQYVIQAELQRDRRRVAIDELGQVLGIRPSTWTAVQAELRARGIRLADLRSPRTRVSVS
jgi:hypothetical protein